MIEIRKTQEDGKQDVVIIAKNVPEIIYDENKFDVYYTVADAGSQIRFRVCLHKEKTEGQ